MRPRVLGLWRNNISTAWRHNGRRRKWIRAVPSCFRRCRHLTRCGIRHFRRTDRLDIRDQFLNLFLAHLSLEGRHNRLESRDDLRQRLQYRLANVPIVGYHLLAVAHKLLLAINYFEARALALRIGAMTGNATQLLKERRAA